MRTRRLIISLLTVGALLAQTSAFAWSARSVLPHRMAPAQTQTMHCHDAGAAQDGSGAARCCCADQCSCESLCATSAAALPAGAGGIGELIAAHFEAINSLRAVVAAPPRERLRPPIAHPG